MTETTRTLAGESMSTERDEQAWTAETVTALVDYAENGPPLSDMVRDLVSVARAYAAALRAPQETGWQPDAVIARFIAEMETALPKLIQHAQAAALAKAREIIGDELIDAREVRQVADAAAVAVLTALKQDAYENGRLMAACIEKRLAAFTPAEPQTPEPPRCHHCGREEIACNRYSGDDHDFLAEDQAAPQSSAQSAEPGTIEGLLLALDTLYRYASDAGCPNAESHTFSRPNRARLVVETWLRSDQPAAPVSSDARPALKPRTMEFFASKFTGLGVGKAGECRVVIRTDKKRGQQFVQIIDDDGIGVGFTPREVPALIESLQKALDALLSGGAR